MRSVTSAQLMTRLEEMLDIENDPHVKPAEKYSALSSALAEVWDKLILVGGGTDYVKSVTFNTTAGTAEKTIASACPDGDFYKVSQMYVDEGSGQFRPLPRVHPAELHPYKPIASVVPIKLYYLPCAPVWDGSGDTAFDGVNGWEELVLVIAAQTIMNKKGDSAGWLGKRQRELESRLTSMASRNDAEPARVVRRRRSLSNAMYFPWRNNVSAWNIRGTNFEFYYKDGVL